MIIGGSKHTKLAHYQLAQQTPKAEAMKEGDTGRGMEDDGGGVDNSEAARDARLVCAMKVYGLDSILTFNAADFKRFPGIKVNQSAEVLSNG